MASRRMSAKNEHRIVLSKASEKAKIRVRGQELVGRTNEHTHCPERSNGEVQKLRSKIKQRAIDSNETLRQILAPLLQECDEETAVRLPSVETLKRSIRRRRQ